ncbi:hypothetical protein Poli38472_013336 [Pythium oligandrum]|uniref:Uncharacterized protein n=1 Tax=Pythium oligandrum TaxID=41045 RepID=A0A8K1C7A8_PYTOL|nr:hypothetical protein Poli38472_013336 [Pythium oligandrum]|eukprot:TMW57862.1 hypothetical protein Poli38472_013336 [Pythium oligandrum]
MELLEEVGSVAMSDVCVRDIEASMTHTAPLSVREAWSIAMCWKRHLERRAIVSIRLATDDTLDGMQSYEWIEIEGTPGRDERALGAAVHAICTTWTLLSRCRGYRGEENPVFWKYVVDMWCNRDVNDQVSNTIRFFTRHAFPRFRLNQITHFRGERSAMEFCRAVFGQDTDALRVSWIQSTLNDIRSRLLPHIESTRQYGPIPISLGLATHRLVSCIPDLLTPDTGDVSFVPYEICLQGHFSVNASAIAALKTLLLSHHLDIPLLTLPESFRDDDEALVDFVRVVFGLESQVKARVRSIAIDKYQVSDQDVAALCSALPHGRYLRSFSFSRSQSPPPVRRRSIARSFGHSAQPSDSSRHDWAWLGYALFHPATESSSWRELQLQNVQITAEAVQVLMSMARGNNLLAVLKHRQADCTSYTVARLACGAKIMSTTHAFTSHLVTLNEVQDVDVPGVSSTDLKALGKFVPVIIRGYGLAYTSRRNVVSLTPRPASPTAWLTGLKIDAQNHDDPIARFLPDLLTMLGRNLEHLDIRRFGEVEPQLLRKLLLLTPQLRSLALNHSEMALSPSLLMDSQTDGIFARWVGYFVRDHKQQQRYASWMEKNAKAAWSVRNSNGLMWAKFGERTPDNTVLTSWAANSGVAVMSAAFSYHSKQQLARNLRIE